MHDKWRLPRRLGALCLTLVFAGCSTQHATYVPDGRRGFVITCSGVLSSWSTCLINAGRACGNHGYETIKGDEDDRSMLIACQVPQADGASLHTPP